ncbi:MAG: NAD-dependent alcohol dehydrogenase [Thermoplasmata archaeon]|nr:MAG: NAD-dependent alcohol dehydrogenase [Thermoplasmata archaeon]
MQFSVPTKIIFGEHSLSYIKNLRGYKTALIFSASSMKRHGFLDEMISYLKVKKMETIIGIPPEPEYDVVTDYANKAREVKPDIIIAIGGGSVIDVAKAVKIFYEFPEYELGMQPEKIPHLHTTLIAIPSTSGTGSEVSAASVLKKNGIKHAIVSNEIIPNYAILDARLPRKMPKEVARDTGIDAFVHAMEAYVSKLASLFSDGIALRALKEIKENFFLSLKGDEKAREKMHYASTLAGIAFMNARLGLCHAMAHKAAMLKLSHGRLNALFFPYVMEFNMKEARKKYKEVAKYLGFKSIEELIEFVKDITQYAKEKIDLSVKEQFMENIEKISKMASHDPLASFNPRKASWEEIKEIYAKSLHSNNN